MNKIKKLTLSLIGTLLFIPEVNAMSFKDGNNLYVLEEREITCTTDYYFIDVDKNNDLIYMHNDADSLLDVIKVNKNNECVEMSLQEKYDYWKEYEIYYELYGGGLQIDTEDEEYKIIEHTYYSYNPGYIKTTDTEVNESKTYHIFNTEYNYVQEVINPTNEELNTYYEEKYFVFPESTTIDNTLTYYKRVELNIYEKVENPKQEEIEDYYLMEDLSPNNEKTVGTVNQERFKELLEEYGNVFVTKHKEKDNFYISVLTDLIDREDYIDMIYSVYTPEGILVEPFKDIFDFNTYHNSLFGVTTENGLNIYNDKYELLYTNKDLVYLIEYGYYDDNYIMESWDPVTDKSTIYTMKRYKFTSEDNQTYKNKDLLLTSNRDLSEETTIMINDKELDKKYYSIENNELTLKKEYLSTLDKGTYTVKINLLDDEYLTQTFKISNNLINNPSTYDGITNYIIIAVASLIIIIGTIIYFKKTKRS